VSLESLAGSPNAWLRFDYVTDDAVNLPGLCLRNLRVVEAGETLLDLDGEEAWDSQGFCKVQNQVPQQFLLQVVSMESGELCVERVLLRDGDWEETVPLGDPEDAMVIVSAMADHTTERADYKLELFLSDPQSQR